MDLNQLVQQIDNLDSAPPFDSWNPPECGNIDMQIKQDGTWWYMGTPIGRARLVSLFAKVLIKEGDNFYLKTPAEKIGITVDDAPFVITQWNTLSTSDGDAIEVTSNLGHKAVISAQHPLTVSPDNPTNLYVELHRKLLAKVHRNVYYQWVERAEQKKVEGKLHVGITSGGMFFSLGQMD